MTTGPLRGWPAEVGPGETVAEISADQLLAAGRRVEPSLTRWQLARWHRRGLLPAPRVTSLGRGKGTASLYPQGSVDQLEALLAAHRRWRRLDRVALDLWWQGLPVPELAVLEFLDRVAGSVVESIGWLRSHEDPLGAVEATADSPELPSPIRRLRKRLGRADFHTLLWIFAQVATGEFVALDVDSITGACDQANIIERAFGLPALAASHPAAVEELDTFLRHASTESPLSSRSVLAPGANRQRLEHAREAARRLPHDLLEDRAGEKRLAPVMEALQGLFESSKPEERAMCLLIVLRSMASTSASMP